MGFPQSPSTWGCEAVTAAVRRWKPGDHILLRTVLNGRVLSAQPQVVVRDSPTLTALWMPPGTVWMKPTGREDVVRKRLNGDWSLFPDVWNGEGFLRLTEPGRPYSVLVFWTPARTAVATWYVNIEDPLRRTDMGFDYLDQLLDVVFAADRKSWKWKDEDEFEQAVELGLFDRGRATVLRHAAEEAIDRVQQARPPYTDEWMTWSPDPGWTLPSLPPGWDQVPAIPTPTPFRLP